MQVSGTASRREPALNIPAPILLWVGLLAAIHAGRALLSTRADLQLLVETAFAPAPWSIAFGWVTPEGVLAAAEAERDTAEGALRLLLAGMLVNEAPRPWSLVTYSLLHGSWSHLGINSLLFVVFGSSVVRRSGRMSSLALWLAAAAGGAVVQWLYDPRGVDLVIGASAAASGFMAAAATFAFAQPEEGRWAFLRSRGALTLLALWFGGNVAIGTVLGPLGLVDGNIAWPAHIGGLLAGVALYPLLEPGRNLRS